jgi:hypothetical protein
MMAQYVAEHSSKRSRGFTELDQRFAVLSSLGFGAVSESKSTYSESSFAVIGEIQPAYWEYSVTYPGICNMSGAGLGEVSLTELEEVPRNYQLICVPEHSDITLEIERILNWLQMHRVHIHKPEEIRKQLLIDSSLLESLPCIVESANRHLRSNMQLSLELYRDREINYNHLCLYLRQDEYQDDILDIIDLIGDECSSSLPDSLACIHATTDFQPPR